jgi:multiple sugar transport system ATP-binding protein
VPRKEIKTRVEETARLLQIDHLLHRSVSGLAGGDRQRVALGRAIVRRPKCFLMDEPLGTLDTEFRDIMVHELRELHNRIHATTVYVTHDQMEAMAMADKIAVMNHGVIEQFASPQEIYNRPSTMYVADFIGSPPMNFLSLESGLAKGQANVSIDGIAVEIPGILEDRPEAPLALGVRPEHIRFSDASRLRGQVYGTEYLGTNQIVSVDTARGRIKARLSSDLPITVGENVGLDLNPERLVLFDRGSGRAIHSRLYEEARHG